MRTYFHCCSTACKKSIDVGGEDYTSIEKDVRFPVGPSTVECVHIPILNDVCVEDMTEVFSVSISSQVDCVLVEPSAGSLQVTITDEDGMLYIATS